MLEVLSMAQGDFGKSRAGLGHNEVSDFPYCAEPIRGPLFGLSCREDSGFA